MRFDNTIRLDADAHRRSQSIRCAHRRYGEFLLGLYEDPSWRVRRVETVNLLSSERTESRTSLDVDVVELKNRLKQVGLSHLEEVPIPFAESTKGLLLDVDLSLANGSDLQVATSDEDSTAAALLMDHLHTRKPLWRNFCRKPSSKFEHFYAIARSHHRAPCATENEPATETKLGHTEEYFSHSFLMMTFLPLDKARVTLKYRLVQSLSVHNTGLSFSLKPEKPIFHLISMGGVSNYQRSHVRVTAPPGLFIDVARMYEISAGPKPGISAESNREQPYIIRQTPNQVSVYTHQPEPGEYTLGVSFRIAPWRIFTAVWVYSAVIAVLSLCVLVAKFSGVLGNDHPATSSAAALISTIPGVLAAIVFNRKEHEVLRAESLGPQFLLVLNLILLFMGSLAMALSLDTIWFIALWALILLSSVVICFYALRADISSFNALKRVSKQSMSTDKKFVEHLTVHPSYSSRLTPVRQEST